MEVGVLYYRGSGQRGDSKTGDLRSISLSLVGYSIQSSRGILGRLTVAVAGRREGPRVLRGYSVRMYSCMQVHYIK